MSGSLLAFFHLYLISVPFSGPSLHVTEMKLYGNFTPSLHSFSGFLNHLANRRQMCLLCWRRTFWSRGRKRFALVTNNLELETKCVENSRLNFSHTHRASYMYMYQRLSNITYLQMIATHRYSPLKTGGSYHTLILTSEYTIPTSYIHVRNSICYWTRMTFKYTKLIEKTINELLLIHT